MVSIVDITELDDLFNNTSEILILDEKQTIFLSNQYYNLTINLLQINDTLYYEQTMLCFTVQDFNKYCRVFDQSTKEWTPWGLYTIDKYHKNYGAMRNWYNVSLEDLVKQTNLNKNYFYRFEQQANLKNIPTQTLKKIKSLYTPEYFLSIVQINSKNQANHYILTESYRDIYYIRNALGLSIKDLVPILEVSSSVIEKYENNKNIAWELYVKLNEIYTIEFLVKVAKENGVVYLTNKNKRLFWSLNLKDICDYLNVSEMEIQAFEGNTLIQKNPNYLKLNGFYSGTFAPLLDLDVKTKKRLEYLYSCLESYYIDCIKYINEDIEEINLVELNYSGVTINTICTYLDKIGNTQLTQLLQSKLITNIETDLNNEITIKVS